MEAAKPTPLLTSKTKPKIATWNIRTMYEAGKAAQVAAEINNNKVSILGLCETRRTVRTSKTAKREKNLYSGHEEEEAPSPSTILKESP